MQSEIPIIQIADLTRPRCMFLPPPLIVRPPASRCTWQVYMLRDEASEPRLVL